MNDLLGRSVAAEERAHQLESDVAALRARGGWSTSDPREQPRKRQRIVVIAGDRVVFADVETEHGYSVCLDHNDRDFRRFVGEDEVWPGWYWTICPAKGS